MRAIGLRQCSESRKQFTPYEVFHGEIPQNSPTPFLKPGCCKYKRMNKMDPNARDFFIQALPEIIHERVSAYSCTQER